MKWWIWRTTIQVKRFVWSLTINIYLPFLWHSSFFVKKVILSPISNWFNLAEYLWSGHLSLYCGYEAMHMSYGTYGRYIYRNSLLISTLEEGRKLSYFSPFPVTRSFSHSPLVLRQHCSFRLRYSDETGCWSVSNSLFL